MDETERWISVFGLVAVVAFTGWTAYRAGQDRRIGGRARGVVAALVILTPPTGAAVYWLWSLLAPSATDSRDGAPRE